MVEHQLKDLCYNCDDNYFPWNKCKEQFFFMATYKDSTDEEVEVSLVEDPPPTDDPTPPSNPLEVKPLISLNALPGLCYPQILKLIGYINLLLIFMITLTWKPII